MRTQFREPSTRGRRARRRNLAGHLLTGCLLLLAPLAACDEGTPAGPEASERESTESTADRADPIGTAAGTADAEVDRALATLRRATARYHRVDAAIADSFEQILPCMEHPTEGGLGIPYARLDRFDTTIDLSEPEILFYEPRKNGKLRLVAAEPVVPIALWGEDAPSMFGREFHRNEEHGLYGLHMWVWKYNPGGTFSFWNPSVSCAFGS